MSTQPHITEEQLYQEFFQQENARLAGQQSGVPGAPPPLPQYGAPPAQKITLGGQEFSYKDPAELQTLIQRYESVQAANLRTAMEQAQAGTLQGQNPQNPGVSSIAPTVAPRPVNNFDFEKYEKVFKESPAKATDLALGASLGAPEGVGASEYMKLIGVALQQQQATIEEQKAAMEELKGAVGRTSLQTEISLFHDKHQEFIQNRENAAILEETRNKYGLPMTAVGYDAALKLAQADKAPLQLRQTSQGTQQFNPNPQYPPGQPWAQYPAPQNPGLPQIGGFAGSPSHASPNEEAFIRMLNSKPTEEAFRLIDEFEGRRQGLQR